MLLASIAFALAALTVEVAPDQPFRQVYVDEPLIVGFVSDAALTLDGVFIIEDAAGARETVPLPPVALSPNEPHWQAFPDVALTRGSYAAHIAANGTVYTSTFCRVDRPAPAFASPALVRLTHLDADVRLALKGLSVRGVRFDAGEEDLAAALEAYPRDTLRLVVSFGGFENSGSRLAALSESFGERIVRWETSAPDGAATLAHAVETLQQAGNGATMALVAHTPQAVADLLSDGAGRFVSALALAPANGAPPVPALFRAAAEAQGYEGVPLFPRVSGLDLHGSALQQALVRLLASPNVHDIELDAAHLMEGPRQPAADFPGLMAIFGRLSGAAPAGQAPLDDAVEAHLFRKEEQWILVAWSVGEKAELRVPIAPGAPVGAFNAFNNPLETLDSDPAFITVPVGPAPVFIIGRDGPLPALAAAAMARSEARQFNADAGRAGSLVPKAHAAVLAIAEGGERLAPRLDFFTILQALPDLERRWHAGQLTRGEAVPAIASLARLARHLAVLEAERDEPFLEPLSATLAKCNEYLSRYLTGASQRTRGMSRGDWLLQEVSRLAAEARELHENGRPVEANAVAALAEWRARALAEAAKARPLHEPEAPSASADVSENDATGPDA